MRLPALKNFVLIVASVAVGLVAMEIALWAQGISYPEFHRLDDQRGWAPRPHVEGWWTKEGKAYLRYNEAGFRDHRHTLAKPDGVFRLAVLGDSFTEARALPLGATFWSLAGRGLGACPALSDASVEVLNFGVSGYGTAQQLITLRSSVLVYEPDLVLLAFYSGNDVGNNNRALDGHADRPYYILDGETLVLDDSFRRSA
ncbi:MAG: SGNH/GDSL hydrolase family protein, partial [Alphaproteobacteria bacterium]